MRNGTRGTNVASICCGVVIMSLTLAMVVNEADKESGLASCADSAATSCFTMLCIHRSSVQPGFISEHLHVH